MWLTWPTMKSTKPTKFYLSTPHSGSFPTSPEKKTTSPPATGACNQRPAHPPPSNRRPAAPIEHDYAPGPYLHAPSELSDSFEPFTGPVSPCTHCRRQRLRNNDVAA